MLALGSSDVLSSALPATKLAHYTDPGIYLSGRRIAAKGEGYRFAPTLSSKDWLPSTAQAAIYLCFGDCIPNSPENIWLPIFGPVSLCSGHVRAVLSPLLQEWRSHARGRAYDPSVGFLFTVEQSVSTG